MAWISVKDQLPAEDQEVLVWGHTRNRGSVKQVKDEVHPAMFDPITQTWIRADSDGWSMVVTHWQPMPENPNAAIACIKQVLAGDTVLDILQEWGEGRLDREPILQPDEPRHGKDQHPEFLAGDGMSAEPSNKDPIEEF